MTRHDRVMHYISYVKTSPNMRGWVTKLKHVTMRRLVEAAVEIFKDHGFAEGFCRGNFGEGMQPPPPAPLPTFSSSSPPDNTATYRINQNQRERALGQIVL